MHANKGITPGFICSFSEFSLDMSVGAHVHDESRSSAFFCDQLQAIVLLRSLAEGPLCTDRSLR